LMDIIRLQHVLRNVVGLRVMPLLLFGNCHAATADA
jgi:hypothetical protein